MHDYRTTGIQFSSRTQVGSDYEVRCAKCGKERFVGVSTGDRDIEQCPADTDENDRWRS